MNVGTADAGAAGAAGAVGAFLQGQSAVWERAERVEVPFIRKRAAFRGSIDGVVVGVFGVAPVAGRAAGPATEASAARREMRVEVRSAFEGRLLRARAGLVV